LAPAAEGRVIRRRALLAAPLALSGPARAENERFIWARNEAGEEVLGAYRQGEAHDPAMLRRLARLFRDLRANAEGPLPPLLVDMLSLLQEQWNHARPLVIISGFRTPRTNASAEGAAPASLHLSGQAADIRVPGLGLDFLAAAAWRLSQRLGFMGVGFYPAFVHLDIGAQRAWTRIPR
jgi:uncharacterized protein YcbK (DUF882 family)